MNEDRHTVAEHAQATPLERLRGQLLQRWRRFPQSDAAALEDLLRQALARAAATAAEVITVVDPVSRPMRLRLAVLADAELDSLYRQEWAELAVSDRGVCYLVYRRRGGVGGSGDYATVWSPASTLPTAMSSRLPEALAAALLESDVDPAA